MKLLPFLCLLWLTANLARAEENFHIYAPVASGAKLLIVEAKPTTGGVDLKLAGEMKIGVSAFTITKHRTKPVLYVSGSSKVAGTPNGAVISLDANGGYQKHAEIVLDHSYAYLSLDRTSRFLLGADYGKGFVDVYALDESGTPGKRVTALNEGRSTAHCILTTQDNKFVYVPYVKENNAIYQYRFDAESGQMTALEPKNANPPEGTGPRHMAYHPTKPVVYFSNEQHLGVSAYDIDKTGVLRLRQICASFAKDTPKDGVSASDIVLSLDGRFLFCGIRGRTPEFNVISRYRVKEGVDLEFLGLTPADKIPWGFALSPDGRFLMVAAYEGSTLKAYQISESGELKEVGSLAWDKNIMSIVTR